MLLSTKLYLAISGRNPDMVEALLKQGANLFEEIQPQEKLHFLENLIKKIRTPFQLALHIDHTLVLKNIFNHLLENNIKLGLAKKYSGNPRFKSINYLQYMCYVACSYSSVEIFKCYCDKMGFDFKALINQPIVVIRNNQEEYISIGEALLMQVSIRALEANWIKIDSNSDELNELITSFNRSWSVSYEDEFDLANSYLMTANFCGGATAFLYLIENGLNVNDTLYDGSSVLVLLDDLCKYSKDVKKWNKHIKQNLLLDDNAKLIGDDYINDGKLNIAINAPNLKFKHPININLIINYEEVKVLIENALKIARENELAQMQSQAHNQRFQALESKFSDVESKLDEVESKVANISEVRCENVRKAILGNRVQQSDLNNIALNCFDNLQKHLVNVFTAKSVGASGLVKLKNTSESLELLKLANTALAVTTNNISVPFLGLVAATTTALIDMAENRKTKIANQNYFDATVGVNTNLIAIDVALIVTAQAMNVYGKSLDAAVIKELKARLTVGVNHLSSDIKSELALICALIRPATQYIKAAEAMGVVGGKQFTPALMNVKVKNNKVAQEPAVKKTNSGKKRLGCTIS